MECELGLIKTSLAAAIWRRSGCHGQQKGSCTSHSGTQGGINAGGASAGGAERRDESAENGEGRSTSGQEEVGSSGGGIEDPPTTAGEEDRAEEASQNDLKKGRHHWSRPRMGRHAPRGQGER
eukprot:6205207-Pleurochrysis_carterae.AAC.1